MCISDKGPTSTSFLRWAFVALIGMSVYNAEHDSERERVAI
jgi:hypothetical protein